MTQAEFDHLLSRIKALPPEQMRRLRQQIDRELAAPRKSTTKKKATTDTATKNKPLTREEFHRRLLAEGRLAFLPDPALDIDDGDPDDQPIAIEGEPLSETIIRERR
jgi:hypothetical protein